jgi:hypothetical protein
MVLRGIAQGVATLHLSKAPAIRGDYGTLLERRHRLQELAFENRPFTVLPDLIQESDEMFQNAGEKGGLHLDPADPPRRRANKKEARHLPKRPTANPWSCRTRLGADPFKCLL